MPDWAGGAYIAEEVAPWIDSSGNLVAATGGAAVGTPAPGSPDHPDGGGGGGGGGGGARRPQLHRTQPRKVAGPHLSGWRDPYDEAASHGTAARARPKEHLLRHSHAKVVPLGPAQIRHRLDGGRPSSAPSDVRKTGKRFLTAARETPPPGIPESWTHIRDVIEKVGGRGDDAAGAFAKSFIRKHWSGPAFSAADLKAAEQYVRGHVVFRGAPSLTQLGKNVAKNLLNHGYALEAQMFNASPARIQKLDRQLSATAFVLYVVTGGDAGGYLPAEHSAWGPRP
jgi:hypothetical protein